MSNICNISWKAFNKHKFHSLSIAEASLDPIKSFYSCINQNFCEIRFIRSLPLNLSGNKELFEQQIKLVFSMLSKFSVFSAKSACSWLQLYNIYVVYHVLYVFQANKSLLFSENKRADYKVQCFQLNLPQNSRKYIEVKLLLFSNCRSKKIEEIKVEIGKQ